MKSKGLYYAAKTPCHVATRTAGYDSDSAGSSDVCVSCGRMGVEEVMQPLNHNFYCHHAGEKQGHAQT